MDLSGLRSRVIVPDEGNHFVNRRYGRVGLRVASVGLLVMGIAGGVYLGRDQQAQQEQIEVSSSVLADAAERDLLIERQ
ncbi:MAG TPA: hypothetical protein VFO77_07835, partial [Actinoplanes sp.]|nr:hypothetical protein [Actinoplanes sp.]